MDRLIAAHGPAGLPSPAPVARRFHDLVESIAYQQLSGSAAATIWGRVVAAAELQWVTPQALLELGPDGLRACGLSNAKCRSTLELSDAVLSKTLRFDRIARDDDEAVIDHLTQIWGVGRWTAQMFLMFTLGRVDVWPTGDLGVRNGYGLAWGLEVAPSAAEMTDLGTPFAGSRSLAAWYCWRAADSSDGARS